ncbi:hypothetical protein ACFL5B_02335 [Candidatus Latescibacterota bacterium]
MTIEERFEKLEHKLARAQFINRLLAVLGIGVFLGMWFFAPGTLTAQNKVQDEVRAKKFVLEDENGKIRAGLTVTEYGPTLVMSDDNSKLRAWLSVNKDESRFTLYDENGKRRTMLATTGDCASFTLFDENDMHRVGLSVNEYGPGLALSDENGKRRVMLLGSKDRTGQVCLCTTRTRI